MEPVSVVTEQVNGVWVNPEECFRFASELSGEVTIFWGSHCDHVWDFTPESYMQEAFQRCLQGFVPDRAPVPTTVDLASGHPTEVPFMVEEGCQRSCRRMAEAVWDRLQAEETLPKEERSIWVEVTTAKCREGLGNQPQDMQHRRRNFTDFLESPALFGKKRGLVKFFYNWAAPREMVYSNYREQLKKVDPEAIFIAPVERWSYVEALPTPMEKFVTQYWNLGSERDRFTSGFQWARSMLSHWQVGRV